MATRQDRAKLMERARALADAAAAGDLAKIKSLVKAEPALIDMHHGIMAACLAGRPGIVKFLLDHGTKPDIRSTGENFTPLLRVISLHRHDVWTADHRKIIEMLLAAGADINLRACDGTDSPITMAAHRGRHDVVEMLRERSAGNNIFDAAISADAKRVKTMLKKDPSLAKAFVPGRFGPRTALMYCAHSHLGDKDSAALGRLLDIAKTLIAAGTPVNEATIDGQNIGSPLGGHPEMMRLLLKAGSDPSPALSRAAFHGELEDLHMLIAAGADLNRRQHHRPQGTLLTECIRLGRIEAASALLAAGADPNLSDANGWTAAHYAARRGIAIEVFQKLLDAGADLHAKDHKGLTPVALAAAVKRRRPSKLALWLAQKGAEKV